VVKLSRNVWFSILVWLLLLGILIVGLQLTGLSSVVVGGALGAFCGATLVVVFSLRERAAAKRRGSSGPIEGRYGRR
jgi:hypothetical protein